MLRKGLDKVLSPLHPSLFAKPISASICAKVPPGQQSKTSSLHQMTISRDIYARLQSVIELVHCASSRAENKCISQVLALPVVLILGPGGCGKTQTAIALAKDILCDRTKWPRRGGAYVTADQLLGGGVEDGTRRLMEVLRWAVSLGKRHAVKGGYFVLVLDGMEQVIAARNASKSGHGGLPILLDVLRGPVPGLCLILTAGLVPDMIDPSILDRYCMTTSNYT